MARRVTWCALSRTPGRVFPSIPKNLRAIWRATLSELLNDPESASALVTLGEGEWKKSLDGRAIAGQTIELYRSLSVTPSADKRSESNETAAATRGTPARHDRGRFAGDRRRKIRGQTYCRRHGARGSRYFYRWPRCHCRGAAVSPESSKTWTERPYAAIRKRSLVRRFSGDANWADIWYTIHAWVDHWETWRRDLLKRIEAEYRHCRSII